MSWRDPAPGEREAGERSWETVREAFAERLPAPRRHDRRPLVAVAVGAAILAAAFTSPGHAVLGSIRDAVQGEKNARPALFGLPAPGRLLVNSAQGAWVVQRDGSKRLLPGYRDASWSPHGLYVAAIHGDELRAIEPSGDRRWSIGRPNLASPRWSSFGEQDERVAYLSGKTLRVIDGNGTDDRLLARRVTAVTPAWKPGTHVVTYFDAAGEVRAIDVDSRRQRWRTTLFAAQPILLAWSDDGTRLLAATSSELAIIDGEGKVLSMGATGGRPAAASFAPGSHHFALLRWLTHQRRNGVEVIDADRLERRRQIFAGAGTFDAVSWSPTGRWLILDWDSADQWLFIRSAAVRKLVAVSNIEENFGPDASPAGWCCP